MGVLLLDECKMVWLRAHERLRTKQKGRERKSSRPYSGKVEITGLRDGRRIPLRSMMNDNFH
jgi:hypothetical protein